MIFYQISHFEYKIQNQNFSQDFFSVFFSYTVISPKYLALGNRLMEIKKTVAVARMAARNQVPAERETGNDLIVVDVGHVIDKRGGLRRLHIVLPQLKKGLGIRDFYFFSAFNANVDAVIKVSGKDVEKLIENNKLDTNLIISEEEKAIRKNEDAIRGILHCFKGGIAEEWLIENVEVFYWLNKNVDYDKLQMGGQGGIVANAMAVCGVQNVYVHCASSPKEQSQLFLDLPNLLTKSLA